MSYDKHSTFDLAVELQIEALEAAMEKENFLLNSDANCVKGYIAYVYDEDGTAYTSGQTDAFLKITGSISAFHAGERIHVASAAGDATPNLKLKVNDVIADEYFRGVNVGPGIVVTIDTDGPGTSSADSNFDTVEAAANAAPSTYIVYSTDEASTASQNFPGAFGALCDYAASPAAYFGITRTAVGSAWAIPYGRWYDSDGDGTGTKVVLDIDTHFGAMFKTFGRTLSAARQYRKNRKFQLTDGIICQASPDLIAEVAKQAGDSSTRFTVQAATSLSEGQRKNLTAVAGWEGVVLHTPYSSMPPIVLQEEPLMPDGLIRVFEPSACVKYCLGGRKPQWVPNGSGNGYWHNRRNATTGNLTMTLDAAGFFVCTYFWDQPRLVYQMGGLTDSL